MKLSYALSAAAAFLLILNAEVALAQRALVQQFTASTVYLSTGDTLTGPLTLHADKDVLLITMPDQSVKTMSPVGVQAFAVRGEQTQRGLLYNDFYDFYDARRGYYYGGPGYMMPRPVQQRPDTAVVRMFRVFRWDRGNDYSDFLTPGFFEQLSHGPVMLLRREMLIERPISSADPYFRGYGYGYPYGALPRGMAGYYTDIRDNFFLGTPEGKVVRLRNPKKDLLSYFRSDAKQVEQYAKDNKLSFSNARELAYIVNYANSLHHPAD